VFETGAACIVLVTIAFLPGPHVPGTGQPESRIAADKTTLDRGENPDLQRLCGAPHGLEIA
jgi:hypothetical protein